MQQTYQYQYPNELNQPQQQIYNHGPPQSQPFPNDFPNQPSFNPSDKVTGSVDPNSLKYKFRNQQITGYSFLPNIKCSVIFSLTVGILLTILGIVIITVSATVIEVEKRYDDICGINQTDCVVTIEVTEAMSKPVYFYLGVQNFYQNHRLYVKSYSDDQLLGEDIDEDTAKDKCTPIYLNSDLGSSVKAIDATTILTPKAIANPCGMVANSWIQDDYILADSAGNNIHISTNGIAWSVDKDRKFKRNAHASTQQYIDVLNERFINWMSFYTLYNWKKLWGIIDQDLPIGTYKFTIKNYYDVLNFSGEKHVILSNVTSLGGTSKLLAVLLLAMGGAYILLAAAVGIFKFYQKLSNSTNTALDFNWD